MDPKREAACAVAEMATRVGFPTSVSNILLSCFDSCISKGTLSLYKRVREDFFHFIEKWNVPASALHKPRNLFLASLIDQGKLKSLHYQIAALSHFFGPLPAGDQEVQRALLKGADRTRPPVVHRKKSTPGDIETVVGWALKSSSTIDLIGATMILLMDVAFLRVSELCTLQFGDITFKGDSVWWLFLKRSKVDQQGIGTQVAFRLGGRKLLLWEQFKRLNETCSALDFLFSSKRGGAPSRDYVTRRIKETLQAAGLGSRQLTTHSFRGGAATAAIRAGIAPENVMRVGRWKTQRAFLSYVEPTPL